MKGEQQKKNEFVNIHGDVVYWLAINHVYVIPKHFKFDVFKIAVDNIFTNH